MVGLVAVVSFGGGDGGSGSDGGGGGGDGFRSGLGDGGGGFVGGPLGSNRVAATPRAGRMDGRKLTA